jgi:serralysin
LSDFEVSGAANVAPSITSETTGHIVQASPASTVVYQATAVDYGGDRVFWHMTGTDAGLLTVDQFGTVRLVAAADLNAKGSYSFTLVADDSGPGATTTKDVTLTVVEAPQPTPVIAETAAANDSLGQAQVIDRASFAVAINPLLSHDDLPSVTIAGTIAAAGDRDAFAIHLEADEAIYLDVDNTSGNLDTVVRLYRVDTDTTPAAENDYASVLDIGSEPPPGYTYNADPFVSFRATTAGTYYFTIAAYDGSPDTGSYELNVSVAPPRTAEEIWNDDIDALIRGEGRQWDHTNLTYAFPTSASQYPEGTTEADQPGEFAPLNAAQQSATLWHLGYISAVSGLTFELAADPSQANLMYAMSDEPPTAWCQYPDNVPGSAGGKAWFNKLYYNEPQVGNVGWHGFMHETGHGLGLKHGHENPTVSYDHDSNEYSVMTYRSYVGSDAQYIYNETNGMPSTLMMLDIAALQRMYGANFTSNAGNTVYTWSPSTGEWSIDGVGQGIPGDNRIFMTVWDGGGTDTYDLSGYSTALTIDLRPGEWTQTGALQTANLGHGHYARGNIANALQFEGDPRSLIENAIGGSAGDTLIANAAANGLTGGGGADVFRWDTIADLTGPGSDLVTDFASGTDKLDLTRLDGRTDLAGENPFEFIGTAGFTQPAAGHGELRYEVAGGVLTLQGDTDADGVADFQIQLAGLGVLAASDFVV